MNTATLRTALVNAPSMEGPTSTSYTSYLIGKNTRNALLSLLDRITLAHRELTANDPSIDAALGELDDFLA